MEFTSVSLEVVVKLNLFCWELNTRHNQFHRFDKNQTSRGTFWPITPQHMNDIDELTFGVDIAVVDIQGVNNIHYKQYGNGKQIKLVNLPNDSYQFVYTLDNFEQNNKIQFDLLNMQWFIQFIEDSKFVDMQLNIKWDSVHKSTNNKSKGKKTISVRYTLFIKQTNTRFISCAVFDDKNCTEKWGKNRLLLDLFHRSMPCNIELTMDLIGIFDSS